MCPQYQSAWMTWEGEMFHGKEVIVNKLTVGVPGPYSYSARTVDRWFNSQTNRFSPPPPRPPQTLPFKTIQHNITKQDCQPTPDNCIVVMVMGQLKVSVSPLRLSSIYLGPKNDLKTSTHFPRARVPNWLRMFVLNGLCVLLLFLQHFFLTVLPVRGRNHLVMSFYVFLCL